MTAAEILAMQPGPELDIVLATALGGRCSKGGLWDGDIFVGYVADLVQWEDDGEIEDLPPLSSTWEGLGLLAAAMAAKGYWLLLKSPFRPGEPFFAGFTPHNETGWDDADFKANGNDGPEAAAKASLLALEGGL